MVKSVTMVMANKILSKGHHLLKISGMKKEWKNGTVK